jgi:hypothetical protein
MIAAAMIRVLVADRADDGEFVEHLRELGDGLAEMNARDGGRDRLESAANFRRRVRFRIESFVMRRPAIEPDHDAIDIFRRRIRSERSRRLRPQTEQVAHPDAKRAANSELDEVTPGEAGAIAMERHEKRGGAGESYRLKAGVRQKS